MERSKDKTMVEDRRGRCFAGLEQICTRPHSSQAIPAIACPIGAYVQESKSRLQPIQQDGQLSDGVILGGFLHNP